jgi:UDP-N-acetylmuramate dehydrogenase
MISFAESRINTMTIAENISLKSLNTFGIQANARYYTAVERISDIEQLVTQSVFKEHPFFILGGGSNVLFVHDFGGLVIQSKILGIEIVREDDSEAFVRVGSGVVWDDFVQWAVTMGLGGAENLSNIPGNVGAAPVQNIGAYGVEAKDIIQSVEVFDLKRTQKYTMTNQDCKFAYRQSIFKQKDCAAHFITHVVFCLKKKPVLNTSYGKIEEELLRQNERSILAVRSAVIQIRRAKLPGVDELGSAGSFFKNPVIDKVSADNLIKRFPEIPNYPDKENMKIPAAWLIENSGLKGFRKGNTGTYPLQPLVIVNYGGATGAEIAEFSMLVRTTVFEKFGIMLEPEVCFV